MFFLQTSLTFYNRPPGTSARAFLGAALKPSAAEYNPLQLSNAQEFSIYSHTAGLL